MKLISSKLHITSVNRQNIPFFAFDSRWFVNVFTSFRFERCKKAGHLAVSRGGQGYKLFAAAAKGG